MGPGRALREVGHTYKTTALSPGDNRAMPWLTNPLMSSQLGEEIARDRYASSVPVQVAVVEGCKEGCAPLASRDPTKGTQL
jgi:hypothetical protein